MKENEILEALKELEYEADLVDIYYNKMTDEYSFQERGMAPADDFIGNWELYASVDNGKVWFA